MPESIEWPRMHPPRRRHRFLLILAVLAVIFFGGRTVLSYYIDVLWFECYGDVFWKTLGLQWGIFTVFTAATFLILYGSFLALKRAQYPDLPSGQTIFIGGQPLKLPVEPVLRLVALGVSLAISAATGAGMMVEWPTLALFWYAPRATGGVVDPIFGKPLTLLSVHPACMATPRRVAAYVGRDYLCTRCFLHPYHGRNPCVRPVAQQLR